MYLTYYIAAWTNPEALCRPDFLISSSTHLCQASAMYPQRGCFGAGSDMAPSAPNVYFSLITLKTQPHQLYSNPMKALMTLCYPDNPLKGSVLCEALV